MLSIIFFSVIHFLLLPKIQSFLVLSPEFVASKFFVLVVLVSDNYFLVKEEARPEIRSFFKIVTSLPMEVQMLLCNRRYQLKKNNVSSWMVDRGISKYLSGVV